MATNNIGHNDFDTSEVIPGVPHHGWRVNLAYKCKKKSTPFFMPRISQLPQLTGLGLRYSYFWLKKKKEGKKPFIDQSDLQKLRPIYGVPIGGIGCGTIGRGYRGEFCRFQMIPGMYKYYTVQADQFIVCVRKNGKTVYQQVLAVDKPSGKGLSSWQWNFPLENAKYHGLYPRAWFIYDLPDQNIRLICRQISPIIPHNYKDSSLPCAVFVWEIQNKNSEEVEVSITFSFKNGQGGKGDSKGGVVNEPFEHKSDGVKAKGVLIHQAFKRNNTTVGVSALEKEGVDVSYLRSFNPKGPAKDLWDDLLEDGALNSTPGATEPTQKGEELATAVCAKCTIGANESKSVEFSLVWDMPVISFKSNEIKYKRMYCRYFGHKGDASPKLSAYALKNYPMWEEKIEEWQNPILNNENFPDWYKSALFNETYYISDGGTIWCDLLDGEQDGYSNTPMPEHIKEYGKFAYLEGHEYRMYNTYDVHHYASFALLMLFPKLQLCIQYDFADAVEREDPRTITYCMNGWKGVLKLKNTIPHDLGDPEDEPWKRMNAYIVHPTYEWKDLNIKFVLQVYRDYFFLDDMDYLRYMYPKAKLVMEYSMKWDTDDDGIIDNGGFADQTFDSWIVKGASAYCGGMWLSAIKFMVEMAKILQYPEDVEKYEKLLKKAQESFERKLWNGMPLTI